MPTYTTGSGYIRVDSSTACPENTIYTYSDGTTFRTEYSDRELNRFSGSEMEAFFARYRAARRNSARRVSFFIRRGERRP